MLNAGTEINIKVIECRLKDELILCVPVETVEAILKHIKYSEQKDREEEINRISNAFHEHFLRN